MGFVDLFLEEGEIPMCLAHKHLYSRQILILCTIDDFAQALKVTQLYHSDDEGEEALVVCKQTNLLETTVQTTERESTVERLHMRLNKPQKHNSDQYFHNPPKTSPEICLGSAIWSVDRSERLRHDAEGLGESWRPHIFKALLKMKKRLKIVLPIRFINER